MSKLNVFSGGRHAAGLASALSLGALVLILGTSPVLAASPTSFGVNLVKNGSAEAGVASSDGQSGVFIPGWEAISDSNFTVVKYGTAGGFPTTGDAPSKAGAQFFSAGAEHFGECDTLIQSIFVKGRNSLVDAHHVQVTLSAWVATYGSQQDNAIVLLKFGDDSNNSLGSIQLPTQTATHDVFHHLTKTVLLPRTTREMTVVLESTRHTSYCDAYFDKISVKLAQV
jgi:hypothetical protein